MGKRLFVFLAILPFIAGQGCRENPVPQPAVLSVGVQSAFDASNSLNPFGSFLMADLSLQSALYASLFAFDTGLNPHPFLVDRFEKKGREVVFFLKRDIRFHNGQKILASDVAASVVRSIQNPELPNPIYKYIEGGDAIFRGQPGPYSGIGVLAPDKFFLRFTRDNDLFPYYLAWKNAPIVPADWSLDRPVFSGPYILERSEEKPDRTILFLRRNAHYVGQKPQVEQIRYQYFKSIAGFEAAVRTGDSDVFLSFMKHSLQIHPSYKILRSPVLGGIYILLNPNKGALRSREFRQTLVQLVDFSVLISRYRWLNFSPATHILPYGPEEYFLLKPLAAKDHRQEAFSRPVKFSITNFRSDVRLEVIEFWQQELRRFNIHLQPEWIDSRRFWTRFRAKDVESAFFYYMMDIPMAFYFYESLFTPGLEINPGYQVPRAAALLDEYRRTPPSLRRLSILAELEEVARQEALLIPVFNLVATVGYKNHVRNMRTDYLMQIPLEEIALEKRN